MRLSALASYADAAYRLRDPFRLWRFTDQVVIAVRGTANLEDFLTDIQFLKCKFIGLNAHSGFVEEFCDIWGPVKSKISPADDIYITGHSLGGAVATLLAYALKLHLGINSTVTTFGSPRVFDGAGAEAYNAACPKTTRVVHNLDLVPRIPKLEFEHVEKLLHLTDDGAVALDDDHWLKRLLRIFKSDWNGLSLENHRMPAYIRAVVGYERRQGAL